MEEGVGEGRGWDGKREDGTEIYAPARPPIQPMTRWNWHGEDGRRLTFEASNLEDDLPIETQARFSLRIPISTAAVRKADRAAGVVQLSCWDVVASQGIEPH